MIDPTRDPQPWRTEPKAKPKRRRKKAAASKKAPDAEGEAGK